MLTLVTYPADDMHPQRQFLVEVPDLFGLERISDAVWDRMQGIMPNGLPERFGCRSMQIGDLVNIPGADRPHIMLCNNDGWLMLAPEIAEKWMQIPALDRQMGWKWCKERNLI